MMRWRPNRTAERQAEGLYRLYAALAPVARSKPRETIRVETIVEMLSSVLNCDDRQLPRYGA